MARANNRLVKISYWFTIRTSIFLMSVVVVDAVLRALAEAGWLDWTGWHGSGTMPLVAAPLIMYGVRRKELKKGPDDSVKTIFALALAFLALMPSVFTFVGAGLWIALTLMFGWAIAKKLSRLAQQPRHPRWIAFGLLMGSSLLVHLAMQWPAYQNGLFQFFVILGIGVYLFGAWSCRYTKRGA